MIELLLSKGTGINIHGCKNETPLVCAVKGGHKDAVECLISRGVDVNKIVWTDHARLRFVGRSGGDYKID